MWWEAENAATASLGRFSAKDWSAMEAQAGISIAYSAKSARADEAIQKMVVGDGNKLYDAMSDNGGGMEDAMFMQLLRSSISDFMKVLFCR